MAYSPSICVLLPVFNHPDTVRSVLRAAKEQFPLFVIDDGSDDTTPRVLDEEKGFTLIRFTENRGKAAALIAGFQGARDAGFTHAISMDADGQHFPEDLGRFAEACRAEPNSFFIGQRDMKSAGAPWQRRISNALSSACFYLETGLRLRDTLCGFRVYPLAQTTQLRVTSQRYAFELEILVRATWADFPVRPIPICTDYRTPSARVSHFRPIRDFCSIARAHFRLLTDLSPSRRR